MYIHLSVHLFIVARINAFIYTYRCIQMRLYVCMCTCMYMYICVLFLKWDLKKNYYYYFTVKIEMIVFSYFVPVIVNVFNFGHFFLPWL